ncbi:MAG: hypothetical protein ACYS47_00860 [Planctomycetota bacterium]|jgi:hypothetical protein
MNQQERQKDNNEERLLPVLRSDFQDLLKLWFKKPDRIPENPISPSDHSGTVHERSKSPDRIVTVKPDKK